MRFTLLFKRLRTFFLIIEINNFIQQGNIKWLKSEVLTFISNKCCNSFHKNIKQHNLF